jgi:hypothetical protein
MAFMISKKKKPAAKETPESPRIKVQLDHRTMLVVHSMQAFKLWKKRYPLAKGNCLGNSDLPAMGLAGPGSLCEYFFNCRLFPNICFIHLQSLFGEDCFLRNFR